MGFETCGPNEVMVISGCCYDQPLKITGGRVWVWPCCQQVQRLSLNTMTVIITSPNIYTKAGVRITVTGVAQVKVAGQNEDMLTRAVEQFLGKDDEEIRRIAQETLEGHQRAIMGQMTVEEIYKDRKKFSMAVFEVASSDLVNMGIQVVSYTLKDISDSEGYLKSLGMPRTAQVQRDARIGEAEARRDAGIRQAVAFESQMASRFANEIEIEKAKRDFALQQAAFDQEVQTRKAQAELAYSLQAAKTKQKIREEEMQIKVVERTQEIHVQEQEIVRRERELEAKIRKPADAEAYRLATLAEANRNRAVMEAQAKAEAIQLRGDAQAEAIQQKARADAEQMEAKAAAWQEYESAAKLGLVLDKLPLIATEVSKPLTECKKITMVASGKGDVGAAKLSGEVIDMVERLPLLVKSLTGFDLSQAVTGDAAPTPGAAEGSAGGRKQKQTR